MDWFTIIATVGIGSAFGMGAYLIYLFHKMGESARNKMLAETNASIAKGKDDEAKIYAKPNVSWDDAVDKL